MAEKRSAWVYVGIGCAVIVVGMAITVGSCTYWLFRQGQRIEAQLQDPQAREQAVLDVLGTDAIPEGYHPLAAFSVPLLMKTALLSDREPDENGEVDGFDERGFIYVELIRFPGADEQELRDYFEGRTDDARVLRDNGIGIDVDEMLGRGVLSIDDAQLMYVSQRGNVATQGYRGEGITTVTMIECPDDERGRMAIWFGPEPEAAPEAGEIDFAGTPADEATLRDFMGQFRFCR